MAAKRFCCLFFLSLLLGAAGSIGSITVKAADWPAWRYDAARSATSPHAIPEKLSLQWIRQFAPPKPAWPEDTRLVFDGSYEPVVVGNTLFLASAQNDSITALDTHSGAEKWKFFAEGPIRFAPVSADNRLYFGSDDGCIYCLANENGELLWRFKAAPAARRVIGNDRMSSVLPVRGGPAIADGKLYFTVGVWPFEGTFLYWLDLAKITSGVSPDSAFGVVSLTDMTPQGYLVESDGNLFIPCGRATVGLFDIAAQELAPLSYDSRGLTDYFVTASKKWLFHGQRVIDLETKAMLPISAPRPVSDGSEFYIAQGGNLVAADILKQPKPKPAQGNRPPEPPPFKASWFIKSQQIKDALGAISAARYQEGELTVDIKAGKRIYGRLGNAIYATEPPIGDRPAEVTWATVIDGTPTALVAADDRLFVTTAEGQLLCFGAEKAIARIYPPQEKSSLPNAKSKTETVNFPIQQAVASLPDRNGFCLVWGADEKLLEPLLEQTALALLVVDPDAEKIKALRNKTDLEGLYGDQVTALAGNPLALRLPPYFATLTVISDAGQLPEAEDQEGWTSMYEMIRPYGGAALLPLSDAGHAQLAPMLEALPGAAVSRLGSWSLLQRQGPLEGAANWSHEYGDPSNSLMSQDLRVRLPLGILWFGGPASDTKYFFDRHFWGPSLTVINGRMFLQGHTTLAAVDIYTGRILWEKTIEKGSSPGRRGNFYDGDHHTGYHFLAVEDGIYLAYPDRCLWIDPVTGKTRAEFKLPESTARWGRIRVWNDLLIASIFDSGKHEASVPTRLVALDRKTGDIVWDHSPEASCPIVAIGGNRVYYFDGHIKALYNDIGRAGVVPDTGDVRTLRALDVATGEEIWSHETPMVMTWLAFKEGQDILVASNHENIQAHRGESGEVMWQKTAKSKGFLGHPESRWDRLILWKDRIIDQRGPGVQYFLETGEPIQMQHPLTGQPTDWEFTAHGHHCNYAVANEHLMTFRADSAGFTNMKDVSTGRLKGFRTGCRNSLIPAGGILNAPNFGHGCTCAYSLFTSLALTHIPGMETWTYSAMKTPTGPVNRVGINLAAPGDRQSESGTLWLDYPQRGQHNYRLSNVAGPSPDVPVEIVADNPQWFRQHPSHVEGGEERFVAASGGEGLTSLTIALGDEVRENRAYDVRLIFSEPEDVLPGERLFDVALDGNRVLESLDVVKEAGGKDRLLVKEFKSVPAGKVLQIELTPVAGRTLLSGVEIVASEG